ncbi:MAG: hypothetical protein K2J42_06420 [Muribaculaceae bacterium]|nr:hypothetical protein [Muribaculaceae bacterium]
MKKLFNLILIVALGAVSFSCSKDKDDEPQTENSIKGIWVEAEDSAYPLLITDECWIYDWVDDNPMSFVPYINASYETLVKIWGGDYGMGIYRYDNKNDFYLVYEEGGKKGADGNYLFSATPYIYKIIVSDNKLFGIRYFYDDRLDDNNDTEVSKNEIMSNSKYGSIDSSRKLVQGDANDYDYRIDYIRYK